MNRIGFDQGNEFRPHGYAVGGYEATGSLTCKRDGESLTATAVADTAEPVVGIDIDTSVFQILAPTALLDTNTISFDEDGWKDVIPFRCVYSGATSSTIVSIATTA